MRIDAEPAVRELEIIDCPARQPLQCVPQVVAPVSGCDQAGMCLQPAGEPVERIRSDRFHATVAVAKLTGAVLERQLGDRAPEDPRKAPAERRVEETEPRRS